MVEVKERKPLENKLNKIIYGPYERSLCANVSGIVKEEKGDIDSAIANAKGEEKKGEFKVLDFEE